MLVRNHPESVVRLGEGVQKPPLHVSVESLSGMDQVPPSEDVLNSSTLLRDMPTAISDTRACSRTIIAFLIQLFTGQICVHQSCTCSAGKVYSTTTGHQLAKLSIQAVHKHMYLAGWSGPRWWAGMLLSYSHCNWSTLRGHCIRKKGPHE